MALPRVLAAAAAATLLGATGYAAAGGTVNASLLDTTDTTSTDVTTSTATDDRYGHLADGDNRSADFARDDRSHDDERPRRGAAEETRANDFDRDSCHDHGSDNREFRDDDYSTTAKKAPAKSAVVPVAASTASFPGLGDRRLRTRRGADPLGPRRIPLHAHATIARSSGRIAATVEGVPPQRDPLALDKETMRQLGYRTVDLLVEWLERDVASAAASIAGRDAGAAGRPAARAAGGVRGDPGGPPARRAPVHEPGQPPPLLRLHPVQQHLAGRARRPDRERLQPLRRLLDGVGGTEPGRARGARLVQGAGSATRPRRQARS